MAADLSVPIAFVHALQDLENWLESDGVPHTTIGGVAVSLLGQPRATQDIDLVIWLDPERWKRLLETGAQYGFTPRLADPLGFAQQARVLLLQHDSSGISIDISCGALPFEQEMIERAQPIQIGTLRLRVPSPEDLVITKAVAGRAKDLADIESLLDLYPTIDLERIRYWVREFAEALELPPMLETIERLIHNRGANT
jgi:predicted nucleotidyltransferase